MDDGFDLPRWEDSPAVKSTASEAGLDTIGGPTVLTTSFSDANYNRETAALISDSKATVGSGSYVSNAEYASVIGRLRGNVPPKLEENTFADQLKPVDAKKYRMEGKFSNQREHAPISPPLVETTIRPAISEQFDLLVCREFLLRATDAVRGMSESFSVVEETVATEGDFTDLVRSFLSHYLRPPTIICR
jgi:hypothetical protein